MPRNFDVARASGVVWPEPTLAEQVSLTVDVLAPAKARAMRKQEAASLRAKSEAARLPSNAAFRVAVARGAARKARGYRPLPCRWARATGRRPRARRHSARCRARSPGREPDPEPVAAVLAGGGR